MKIAVFFLQSEWYIKLPFEINQKEIGRAVRSCINYLIDTPVIQCNSVEYREKAPWKKESKFKSWGSFAKHNELVSIMKNENTMEIVAAVKTKKRGMPYNPIHELVLPFDALEEEIGSKIIEAFKITDAFMRKPYK